MDTLGTRASGRWWEYYALRYFVGTVIGGIVILYLATFPDSPFASLGIISVSDLKGLEIKQLTALGALGFAYCYVASTPMLLVHSLRGQLALNPIRFDWRFWGITIPVLAIVHILAALRLKIDFLTYRWFGALVLTGIVGIQFAMIIRAHLNRFARIKTFYLALARARGHGDSVAEYVESYRHLREHGNSVAIILLELALALVLVSAQKPNISVILLAAWLAPSAYSWLIGSILEADTDWRE